ncbi:Uncharacterised protein [Vibrio cholerae]|nr:Uncharacterised protein [Vibrio cholerae]
MLSLPHPPIQQHSQAIQDEPKSQHQDKVPSSYAEHQQKTHHARHIRPAITACLRPFS